MNATPHTHTLKFEQSGNGNIRIYYGDQTYHVIYTCWPGWRSRARRVARRMVRRHDRQSAKAGDRASAVSSLREAMPLFERQGAWGGDVLRGTRLERTQVKLRRSSEGYWHILSADEGKALHLAWSLVHAKEVCAENGYEIIEEITGPASPSGIDPLTTGTIGNLNPMIEPLRRTP